jgi:hypothetical protein
MTHLQKHGTKRPIVDVAKVNPAKFGMFRYTLHCDEPHLSVAFNLWSSMLRSYLLAWYQGFKILHLNAMELAPSRWQNGKN